jgi:hypothetical protein
MAYSWPGRTAIGPAVGTLRSNVLIIRSTPAVAIMVSRYLFQSCVSASEGGTPAEGATPGRTFGAWCMGMDWTRWLEAEAGVRRSNTRRCESEETAERMLGLCGLNCALYVQLWIGSVVTDWGSRGFQIFTVPSQLLLKNVSLPTRFQWTEKTSRACSLHDWIGKSLREMSKSFMEPSPLAVRSWFSWASDHAVSNSESWVSNLWATGCQRRG